MSCKSTGPMSLAIETCENLQPSDLLPMELPLMSSAAASRARTSAQPEKVQGLPVNDPACGQKSPVWLASYDRNSSSWRTSQHCLVGGLEQFSETWPRSGMMRNGIAYQLPTLVRLTGATGYGSWPTPRANDGEKRGNIANDPRNGLPAAVKYWPTPSAQDNRDRGNLSSPAIQRRLSKGKQLMLSMVASDQSGALNPTWVEWLMGYPIGHTDLKD